MEQLLQQLAKSLGTTVEYLWGVLVHQAPIQASIILVQYFILFLLTYIGWKVLRRKLAKLDEDGDDWEDGVSDGFAFLTYASGVVLLILWFVAFFSLSDVINGFFNPEYWALQKVLSFIKAN